MSNIVGIVSSYRATLAAREAAAAAAEKQTAEAQQREQMRRQLNAERVEGALKSVVFPALEEIRKELVSMDCQCRIEWGSLRDEVAQDRTFALTLRFLPENGHGLNGEMRLEGEFDSVNITRIERVEGVGRAIRSMPEPVAAYTAEYTRAKAEDFLRSIFR